MTTDDAHRLYLNTYRPLAATPAGRQAADDHGLPPFIDGSIRREPDLEHDRPSITCLCRGKNFAPRLRPGDVVVYLTAKGRYGDGFRHRRLTAVLRVTHLFDTHATAAAWYQGDKLPVPSNCMIPDNPPRPLGQTHGRHKYRAKRGTSCVPPDARKPGCGDPVLEKWDAEYWKRADQCGRFVVCEPLFRNLSREAPVVRDKDLYTVFGEIPSTQNPGSYEMVKLTALMEQLGLTIVAV